MVELAVDDGEIHGSKIESGKIRKKTEILFYHFVITQHQNSMGNSSTPLVGP